MPWWERKPGEEKTDPWWSATEEERRKIEQRRLGDVWGEGVNQPPPKYNGPGAGASEALRRPPRKKAEKPARRSWWRFW